MNTSKIRLELALSGTVFLGVAGFLLWRIHYGMDFNDEALSSAAPFRFVLGDHPMRDERMIYQFCALLVYPFFKLYYLLKGSSEGIVLFNRCLFLCLSALVSTAVFFSLEKNLRLFSRVALALIFVCFIPFHMPCVSYNSIALGLSTLAFFSSTLIGNSSGPRNAVFFSLIGILQGAAVFAYPPLAFSFVPPSVYFLKKQSRGFRAVGFYWLGALAVPLAILLFYRVGLTDFLGVFSFVGKTAAKSNHTWNLDKFVLLFHELCDKLPHFWAMVLWGIGFLFTVRSRFFFLRVAFGIALPVLLFFSNRTVSGGLGVYGYVIELGLFGAFFFLLLHRTDRDWKMFSLVYLPSFVLGLMMAWSSNNGVALAGLGLLPAAIAAHLWLLILMGGDKDLGPLKNLVVALPVLLTMGNFIYDNLLITFGDDHIGSLTAKMESGPYKGIYTTPEKKQYWDRLSDEVLKREVPGGVIFFYSKLPGGYLISSMRPATNAVWGGCEGGLSACIDYFQARAGKYGMLVRMKNIFCSKGWPCPPAGPPREEETRSLENLGAKKEKFQDFDIYTVSNQETGSSLR